MGKIDYQAIYEKNKHDWYAMTEEPQKYEALLAGHYSDSNHFVYELLQNAEDERAGKVVVEYYRDKLVFYHDGDPFDENDVRGVSSMLMGTKNKDDASTIGKFGMGFKSVFKYTCQPEIYSDEEGFIIQNYLLPKVAEDGWDFRKAKGELCYPDGMDTIRPFSESAHLTKIVIPFRKIDVSGNTVAVNGKDVLEKLNGLSGEILLFLNYIKDLYWINKETGKYEHITLSQDTEDLHLITCRISGNAGGGKESISRYLKYKDIFDHPEMRQAEVSVAYRVNGQAKLVMEVAQSPIWVYFPTRDDTELPFLIHGSFETAVSREKLMTPSAFNNELFERLGTLIADSMSDLESRGLITQVFIRHIILAAFRDEKSHNTIPGLTEKITNAFSTKPLVPDMAGHGRMAAELRIPVPFTLAEQVNSVLWEGAFESTVDFVAFNNEREVRFTEYFTWLRDKLGIPTFTLQDWAQCLCDLPEKSISLEDDTFEELKKFYDFLSDYREENYTSVRTYTRAGLYEITLRNCISDAWKYLRKAPIVLNAENRLISAYRDETSQIYLSASSKYRTILNDRIVNNLIAKPYHTLLSEGFRIAEFNNYQFVKEKVLQKYVKTDHGRVSFTNQDDFEQEYCEDLRQIFALFEELGDADKVKNMLKNADIIKVVSENGTELFAKASDTYADQSDEGIDLAVYYHPVNLAYDYENADGTIFYTDSDEIEDFGLYHVDRRFYEKLGISVERLKKLGMITTPVTLGERRGRGVGDDYWNAMGDFCPGISVDHLSDNMAYIESHIETELAKKKSVEILRLLLLISGKLKGTIQRRQRNPYSQEEKAHILSELNAYNWLFGSDGKLHPPGEMSRYDLDEDIYADLPLSKKACAVLGFIEKESDRKADTFEKVQALDRRDKKLMFRQLARELGYDLDALENADSNHAHVFSENTNEEGSEEVFDPNAFVSTEFPKRQVRDFENLLQHVRQQFFFADPVKYEKVMRQIRTSRSAQADRAYTTGMYLNESDVNICQMCRKPSRNVAAIEIANFGIEMPQLHLSLCLDCARRYRDFRDGDKSRFKAEIRRAIRELDIQEPEDDYEITLSDDAVIHFTQTHIAEVKEILNLLDEYGVPGKEENKETETKSIPKNLERKPKESAVDAMTTKSNDDQESSDSKQPKVGDIVMDRKRGRGRITDVDLILKHIEVEFPSIGKRTYAIPMCFHMGSLKIVRPEETATGAKTLKKQEEKPKQSLADFFKTAGFEVVDKRMLNGVLWVVGTKEELNDTVQKAISIYQAVGTYCDGGRAVGYRKSWYTRCSK